jgi:hypothetical protein
VRRPRIKISRIEPPNGGSDALPRVRADRQVGPTGPGHLVQRRVQRVDDSIHRTAIVSHGVGQRRCNGGDPRKPRNSEPGLRSGRLVNKASHMPAIVSTMDAEVLAPNERNERKTFDKLQILARIRGELAWTNRSPPQCRESGRFSLSSNEERAGVRSRGSLDCGITSFMTDPHNSQPQQPR